MKIGGFFCALFLAITLLTINHQLLTTIHLPFKRSSQRKKYFLTSAFKFNYVRSF